jgi:hypothetical protein
MVTALSHSGKEKTYSGNEVKAWYCGVKKMGMGFFLKKNLNIK